MGRTLPTECEHGTVIDWGDFGPEDGDAPPPCPDCTPMVVVPASVALDIVSWWRGANEAPGGISAFEAIKGMGPAVWELEQARRATGVAGE